MIRALEGLRGLCAMAVVLYHLRVAQGVVPALGQGHLAVDAFFVLSGFVLARSWQERLRRPVDVGAFLLRRFGRLFPLLLVSTVLMALSLNLHAYAQAWADAGAPPSPLAWLQVHGRFPPWTEWLAISTFTHALGWLERGAQNFPSWSVGAEFPVYLLFALLALWQPGRRMRPAALALAAIGWGASVVVSLQAGCAERIVACLDFTFDYGVLRCLGGFFMGVLAEAAHRHWRGTGPTEIAGPARDLAQCMALALLLALPAAAVRWPPAAFLFPLAAALLVAALADDRGPVAHVLGSEPLFRLGALSYALYLLHMPVVLWLRPLGEGGGRLRSVGLLALLLVLLMPLAAWARARVEEPWRQWFNALADRLVARAPRVATHPS